MSGKEDLGKNIDAKDFNERRGSFEQSVDMDKRGEFSHRTREDKPKADIDKNNMQEKFYRQQADYGVNKRR